jgi:hypothetical protein
MGITLKDVQNFVSGATITKLYVENNEFPYYYFGDAYMGWAENIDTSNFDPFGELGFTVVGVRVEVAASYYVKHGEQIDSVIYNIILNNRESLSKTLDLIKALGSHVSIETF